MTVETFEMSSVVTVTDSAAEHFRKQIERENVQAIRISLKESGCTGFKYVIDEVNSPEDDDITIELNNGVSLYVDSKHIGAIRGTIVDYVQEGLNRNLMMNNPNVKDECGCGESFNF